MDKEAMCNGCNLIFPKDTLRPCTGCQKVDYHNQKCQKKHWPIHKVDCKRFKIEQGKSKIEQGKGILEVSYLISIALVSFLLRVITAFNKQKNILLLFKKKLMN